MPGSFDFVHGYRIRLIRIRFRFRLRGSIFFCTRFFCFQDLFIANFRFCVFCISLDIVAVYGFFRLVVPAYSRKHYHIRFLFSRCRCTFRIIQFRINVLNQTNTSHDNLFGNIHRNLVQFNCKIARLCRNRINGFIQKVSRGRTDFTKRPVGITDEIITDKRSIGIRCVRSD